MTTIKVSKLSKLHEEAKNHPFRLATDRSPKSAESYSDIMEALMNEFVKQAKSYCKKEDIPHPFDRWIFEHQFIGLNRVRQILESLLYFFKKKPLIS